MTSSGSGLAGTECQRKRWRGLLTRLRSVRYARHNKLILGAIIVLSMVAVAVSASWLAPRDPNRVALMIRLTPPGWEPEGSAKNPLGTDQLGRDLLSRIIHGARISLMVGFFSVLTSATLGTFLGVTAGFRGGRLDGLIMRIVDIQLSLPFILMVLLVVALLGPSLRNIVMVFTVTAWMIYARVSRASCLSLREQQYVEAARALGAGDSRIVRRHILPHLISPLLVIASFEMARIITSEAALGFLGLGVPPPAPSWGNMLADGREYIQDAWWIATFPGLALMLTVIGINSLGDGLRDLLDPKLQE